MKTQTLTWKRVPIPLRIAALLVAALLLAGCSRPAFLDKKLPDDGPEIVPSQASAMRFVEKVTAAGQSGVQSGQTSLTITEGEVTSFLSISTQLAQVMQIAEGIDNPQDLSQLQELDLEGLDLEGLGLEGLDLGGIAPGLYRLVCLPIKLVGGDGAPARAILIEE